MIHGIINVLKPTGMSSHDVIGCLRRIYGMKKMGHAGTLDPLAAGVLPVYAGQATRLIEYGDSDVKSYHAEFALGLATDTEDSTGTVVETAAVPDLSADDVRRILASFTGDIEQAPSKYSAINVNGVKAYKLARQDVDFTLPVRHVTIHDLRLLSFDGRRGTFAVTCSKGTYVRSLIR
ncbi:MAG: tRNA pseudouridine(55) synthase TruB, partial [Megasphaera elsdenii]|nr:tRNA pseudouridine(55) synthase TruB [Megasphaera elsdenii]